MRNIIYIILLVNFSLIGETIYFNSNKTYMVLDKIDFKNKGEYYVSLNEDNDKQYKIYNFYKGNEIVKSSEEKYTSKSFSELISITNIEKNKKEIEYYEDNSISKLELYDNDVLKSQIYYYYNKDNNLKKIETYENEELIFTESYYRDNIGNLTKIIRKGISGFYMHFFYNDGLITETWLIEDEKTTKTEYDKNGSVLKIVKYNSDKLITSEETFTYKENGFLLSSELKNNEDITLTSYNQNGLKSLMKEFRSGLLNKKTEYFYENKYLSYQLITGHGKKEEIFYSRDDNGEIILTELKINGILIQKNINDQNNEIIEYYKNGLIYLREYYSDGFKIMKELYLDGILFKSEKYNE